MKIINRFFKNILKVNKEVRRKHNYINYYLEQKDKFMKRFLDEEKSFQINSIAFSLNRAIS